MVKVLKIKSQWKMVWIVNLEQRLGVRAGWRKRGLGLGKLYGRLESMPHRG